MQWHITIHKAPALHVRTWAGEGPAAPTMQHPQRSAACRAQHYAPGACSASARSDASICARVLVSQPPCLMRSTTSRIFSATGPWGRRGEEQPVLVGWGAEGKGVHGGMLQVEPQLDAQQPNVSATKRCCSGRWGAKGWRSRHRPTCMPKMRCRRGNILGSSPNAALASRAATASVLLSRRACWSLTSRA